MSRVELLEEGLALVDSGPLHATIMVSKRGHPLSEAAIEGGQYALKLLEQLASFLPIIKSKSITLKPGSDYPEVINEMILATQAVKDPDFTPLAAVAGTTADLVADYLLKTDATKIVVDNDLIFIEARLAPKITKANGTATLPIKSIISKAILGKGNWAKLKTNPIAVA